METQSSPLGSVDQQVTRYKQVLDVMPAGVILLDANGRVAEANPEAHRLLGEPLTQQRWFDVIQRAFSPRDDDGHEVSLKDGRRVKLAISASDSGQLILITDMTETRLLQSRVSDLQRCRRWVKWWRRWLTKCARRYLARFYMRRILARPTSMMRHGSGFNSNC
jgi:PAS/PAC sensor signal transduction histidine kinase (EC 2.7.13.3)